MNCVMAELQRIYDIFGNTLERKNNIEINDTSKCTMREEAGWGGMGGALTLVKSVLDSFIPFSSEDQKVL